MTALRSLHATRNEVGLAEEDARDIYERVTGKRSTRAMNDGERRACRDELKRLYPAADKRRSSGPRRRLDGPFAKKCQALWIAAWNLGLVNNPRDEALIAFVKRQTGIEHMNWLRDPEDAEKVIEALKAWMAREAGVDWAVEKIDPSYTRQPGYKIASAQARILLLDLPTFNSVVFETTGTPILTGGDQRNDWITVMNNLGERIRSAK